MIFYIDTFPSTVKLFEVVLIEIKSCIQIDKIDPSNLDRSHINTRCAIVMTILIALTLTLDMLLS